MTDTTPRLCITPECTRRARPTSHRCAVCAAIDRGDWCSIHPDRAGVLPAKAPWSGRWCRRCWDTHYRHGDPTAGNTTRHGQNPADYVDPHGRVTLADGTTAHVDPADVPLVAEHFWWLSGKGYAASKTAGHMHRLILGYGPDDPHVDHVNGDTLDNRRHNLRPATVSQNNANTRASWSSTGYKGVTRRALADGTPRYAAKIGDNGTRRHLGTYDTPEDAARAYDAAARELFGPYAATNESLGLLPKPHPKGTR